MTVLVTVDGNSMIVTAPPIVSKFIGQPYSALVRWMSRQPGFISEPVL